MSLLSRLFGPAKDDRAVVRPLWHRIITIAREKHWYAEAGIADTIGGRFDVITLVLSLVLLRMQGDETLVEPSVRLTELFVDDMDGQLRESGIGDMVVGKHIGRLISVLGGRLGAYRDGLAADGDAELAAAVARNVNLIDGAEPAKVAAAMRVLAKQLDSLTAQALLAGEIAR